MYQWTQLWLKCATSHSPVSPPKRPQVSTGWAHRSPKLRGVRGQCEPLGTGQVGQWVPTSQQDHTLLSSLPPCPSKPSLRRAGTRAGAQGWSHSSNPQVKLQPWEILEAGWDIKTARQSLGQQRKGKAQTYLQQSMGNSSLWGWRSTGTGCPGRLWSLLLWRYSRSSWTRSSTAYCRWPCFGRGGGLDHPQRSLPTPTILWFCEGLLTGSRKSGSYDWHSCNKNRPWSNSKSWTNLTSLPKQIQPVGDIFFLLERSGK